MNPTHLLGRLSVSRKLLLIYLLDLTAVIFITSILIDEKFIAINFARKELQGNAYIGQVRDMLFDAVDAHDGERQPAQPTLQAKLTQAEAAYGDGMNSAAMVEALQAALNQPAADSARARQEASHAVFNAGRRLLTQIGDQSNLILDPDLDSYYTMSLTVLRFPELLDQLLQYAHLESSADQRSLLVVKGRLEALLEAIESDYRAAYASNTGSTLAAVLNQARAGLLESLRVLVRIEAQDSGAIEQSRRAVLSNLRDAWAATAVGLDGLLQARIDHLFQRMWMHLGMAAALLAVILFLVFYVARLIALPLRRLAQVADQVQATNDYSLRAEWRSSDEIGQLVTGFNTMLDRLDRERLIQQELAAQARAADAQRELLEAIPIPLLVTAIPDHRILHANTPAHDWVDAGQENPWGSGMERGARARFFQRLADEGAAHEFEAHWLGPRGASWALLSANRLRYQEQEAVLTTFAPINAIKRMEARMKLWASVFEATSEGILVLDSTHKILMANAAILRATGYRTEEMVGRDTEFLAAARFDSEAQRKLFLAIATHGAWEGEYWLKRKNGSETPQWMMVNTVRDELGEPSHTIALFVDIAERKAQEEKIRHLAHHDALTGLPNRLLFDERLKMSLQQAERHHEQVALLFIDLDRFKNINDTLGHPVGDGLLQSVAARLLEAVRAGDTVCRQGGDEFVVILNAVADAKEVAHVIEHRLIPLILQPHCVGDLNLQISCSVGIALYPEDGQDGDTLMRIADAAMYAAKAGGRNNFQFFSAETNRHALERLSMETHLRDALERNEFELHVQPIVDIASGQVMVVEGLLRWRQPSLGLVPPVKFIPIAEENGLIDAIGGWVLEEACRVHRLWLDEGVGPVTIAVNVSPVQFKRGDFVATVMAALATCSLTPGCLQLELTESLMMSDSERSLQQLRQLKTLGFSLSLDDFGTGYSSLSYLQRYPFDKLKIDRSFVRDMIEDPADLAITRTIASLGKTLGMRVVAEGVEYAEELALLKTLGCDEVQGYFVAKPMPAHEFIAWVKQFRATPWNAGEDA